MQFSVGFFASILFVLVTLPVRSQEFSRWFEKGVMRVDLVFTGTAGETEYAFEALKKEPFYSGTRNRLIDPFDYGDHKFQVIDAAFEFF